MSKVHGTNSYVNSAATGIPTRTYHPHFGDVNPFKRQHTTPDEQRQATWAFMSDHRERTKRLRKAVKAGARILPVVNWA